MGVQIREHGSPADFSLEIGDDAARILAGFRQFFKLGERMKHRRMIPPAERRTDLDQRMIRHFPREIHGDHARLRNVLRALGPRQIVDAQPEMFGNRLLNPVDRHFARFGFLVQQVRQQIHDGKHASALNRAKDQVLTQLANAAEGEIPSVLVESTYQREMENIQQQLQMQRVSLDHYLSQVHQTRETFTANVHKAAENNTRARMALLQVAQQENLVPTDEEMTAKMQERADKLKKPLEEIMAKSNVESIRRNEAIRRAADWVIEHSTIEEK